ncbi:glycosyl hydrolase family 18 protein [Azospirillum sp. B4]|uniref:glycosyl hydrolase family 18 protein n=1 Tax=Azospirillum sp. B4 TaxID=95605 RepID=UPI000348E102|nr:glycosyl hydrolase family 18 protein [Azospirillum sp. B4]
MTTGPNLPVRNVIYIQGPYYTTDKVAYQLHDKTVSAKDYYAKPLKEQNTTFILCFAHFQADKDGYGLLINGVHHSKITDDDMLPVATAAKNGTQFLISIGGWANPITWQSIDANPAACATALAAFMKTYGITGIDIDMEDSATATQVYAFIQALAKKVDGLIVTGSPYDATTGFYAQLAALDCANTTQHIRWYNYQWYGDDAPLNLPTFLSLSSMIAGWYGNRSAAYNSAMLNIGVFPPNETYDDITKVTAAMTASTVPWGGFSWWNYPTLSKFSA